MYRFLLTRRWVVASLVVLAAVVAMIELGLWQLRRLDEVGTDNDRVRSQLALPAVPIDQALPPGDDGSNAIYRRVEIEGTYEAGAEIRLDNRSYQGRPGRHLLTPLVTEGGTAMIVDRGWIPLDTDPTRAAPPAVSVRVVGVLFPSERKGTFGPSIPPTGHLTAVPRVDVPRIASQLSHASYPLYLRLQSQTPPAGALPVPPALPDLSDGPHLSYAVQWFLFATVALAVFGALARREARRRAPRP